MEKIRKNFNPKVSIIVPVYNGSNYMREAIDSALSQTYENIEVIIVNDGSRDNTEDIAKSYGDKIRYFAKENGGVATALNLAIKNAKGEYISWLSHDDVYYSDKIEKQIKEISILDNGDRLNTIVMANYSLINEKSELISTQKFHKSHDLEKLNYPLYPLLKGIVHGCALLIPKHCFEEAGYFNDKLRTTQDYDLWFRMFPKYKMLFMSDLVVKSRWHEEQGSKKIETANQEADDLWIKMIKNLSDDQKIAIDNTVVSFYQNTHEIVKNAGYSGAEKYLFDIIESLKNQDISKIKVSVIIPFYNRINWTVEAIRSVLIQTHKNLEIIVVNDASSENIDPIENLAKSDKRIILINNTRQKGVSGARNTGIDNASGKYVAFLDSDDLFLSEKIEKQLEFMVRNGYLFSHTSYSVFSKSKDISKVDSGSLDVLYPTIIVDCFAATPTIMIDADIFKNKKNRFLEKYSIGEDICLWIKISKMTPSKGLNIFLTRVRKHENNAAHDNAKQIEGMGNILDYLIGNFLSRETVTYVNSLNNAFIKIGGLDKNVLYAYYYKQNTFRSDNLQIGDNDLIGNKFNGQDLHLYLMENGIDSKQLVWNKESNDDSTFEIARNKHNRDEIYKYAQAIQGQYSLNNILNPLGYDILFDPLLLNSKLVHFHLVHNHIFDIQLLPLITRLKPTVWTLHDPWALGGHCIHHFECEKWKKQCGDCPNLNVPFGLQADNSALNFALKKDAIKNSNFEIIVASEWMKRKVEQSPIFKNKKINIVPFGINQEIFRPIEKNEARKMLGINDDRLVISFRCDYSGFKGMDVIEYLLKKIKTNKKIVLLILKDKLKETPKTCEVIEYGWVKDDYLLAKIYSASDLFLMPSTVESFGMMAIEAMSCGTLPIVLDGTALSETINAPKCGVSVKRDKNEYLKVVQYYIDHDDERNERAIKCLDFARVNYNKDIYVERVLRVYEDAMLKHSLSDEDQQLMDQIKKYMTAEPLISMEPRNSISNQTENSDEVIPIKFGSILKNSIRVILRKFIFAISPTFRMLSGNRHRMNILLEKIENQRVLNEQKTDIILDKVEKNEKLSEQRTNVILEKVEKLEQINEQKILTISEKLKKDISQQYLPKSYDENENLLGEKVFVPEKHDSKTVAYRCSEEEFFKKASGYILKTDVVLDIGSGIRPQSFFIPKVHICIEPFEQYRKVIKPFLPRDTHFIFLKEDAISACKALDDNSVDTVFMMDIIEHLDKEEGIALLKEADRIARKQIIVFTPLGFYPMHFKENGQKDAWGLDGTDVQEHKSGWSPQDFGELWDFYICEDCHEAFLPTEKEQGKKYSALMAIKTKKFNGFDVQSETPEFVKEVFRERSMMIF